MTPHSLRFIKPGPRRRRLITRAALPRLAAYYALHYRPVRYTRTRHPRVFLSASAETRSSTLRVAQHDATRHTKRERKNKNEIKRQGKLKASIIRRGYTRGRRWAHLYTRGLSHSCTPPSRNAKSLFRISLIATVPLPHEV